MELSELLETAVSEVRRDYAPDPRLSVFEVGMREEGGVLTLFGAVSDDEAARELHRRVALLSESLTVRDAIDRLPVVEEGESPHALVTSATAPMLSGPRVTESHLSQARMGERLTVLRAHGRWLQCRAEDGYVGWVHRGYLRRVDDAEAEGWALGLSRSLCYSLGAEVVDEEGTVFARLPWGARAVRAADGRIVLPDGRTGRASGELVAMEQLRERFPLNGDAVAATARRWLGAPYEWGSATLGGVDCSGLAQALYRTHGLLLPRDSDMQAKEGEPVDLGDDFSALRPGDLLFFAEEPERISHVTLSLGGSHILHSSLGNGGVWTNDLCGELPYEQELRRLFVCARRVAP